MDRYGKMVLLGITPLLTVAVLCIFITCSPLLAETYDFWVQTPTDWINKTEGLGKDLKKQVMSPAGDAFIEVYAAKGNDIGAQAIADGMEQAMRQRDTAYLQNRISSRELQADGQPAILREYTGQYNGMALRCYALYAYGNGGGFAVFGVFVASQSSKYQDTVYTCVTSLRFSPPGQAPSGQPASGQTSPNQPTMSGGGSPYGGGGSPYDNSPAAGCSAIVGKWKWFTGSTAEFGPNGQIPGQGHHWECLDNGRAFKISWNNGQWIDILNLTENGQRLEGKNQIGNRVWGTRVTTSAVSSPSAPSACNRVVGRWHWFTGAPLELGPDGQVPNKENTRWECLDNGKTYRIYWNNGQWIDTLSLTENGQRLEGKNQKGNAVWGTRTQGGAGGQTSAGSAPPAQSGVNTACCSYFGMWDFVPPGIHGVFMPNQVYGERSKSFRYDCSGDQVTIHWGNGGSTTWQRQNKDLLTRKDQWGNLVKATRFRDTVTLEGKTYKACTGEPQVSPPGGGAVPAKNNARKISGNMGAQWGFAHGSLKPSEPSKWELATVSGVTLTFLDPYKKGQQHYTVRAFSPSGTLVAQTAVGMSGTLVLSPGTYTVEVATDIHYAGWRCEWK